MCLFVSGQQGSGKKRTTISTFPKQFQKAAVNIALAKQTAL
jgi:hypothetical protein